MKRQELRIEQIFHRLVSRELRSVLLPIVSRRFANPLGTQGEAAVLHPAVQHLADQVLPPYIAHIGGTDEVVLTHKRLQSRPQRIAVILHHQDIGGGKPRVKPSVAVHAHRVDIAWHQALLELDFYIGIPLRKRDEAVMSHI